MASIEKRLPVIPLATVLGAVAALAVFPPFRIVRLQPPATAGAASSAVFDASRAAGTIWRTDLPAAARRAAELSALVPALRENPGAARTKFAPSSGLGTAYFFVRGSGKIVARERNVVLLAVDGAPAEIVALRIGPVFGNTVRDGCGLLDLNAFPGLTEFNALSAALNALVEQSVLPALRERAVVGATVTFVGCAEAPESAPDAGEALFTVVPVQAAIR